MKANLQQLEEMQKELFRQQCDLDIQKAMLKHFIKKKKSEQLTLTRCCETLKDKYEIVFEDWLKDHKFEQSNNGFHKNGIEYKVNEITWMYIQDVYNL